jgi:hypothetical protein
MRRTATFLAALTASITLVSVAAAATDPGLPPAGAYTLGGKDGFKVNKQRSSLSGFRYTFVVGNDADSVCSPSPTLPEGKITVSIKAPLKLSVARRGGYTAYIVGRSTPKTSNGITAIPKTFRLSSGGTAKGTMYLVFNYDRPKSGDGQLIIAGCTLLLGFHKR